MAEIKKIKLGSTTYDIRDASADSRLTTIEGTYATKEAVGTAVHEVISNTEFGLAAL
jgi:hypothetical protein